MGHTIDTLIEALKEQVEIPKADFEKNMRSLLNEFVTKMDLVSQQELDRQKTALDQANQKLIQLQQQLIQLENKMNSL